MKRKTHKVICAGEEFQVPRALLVDTDLFGETLQLLEEPSYDVKTCSMSSSFQSFIEALEGSDISITTDNYKDLKNLSAEFGTDILDEALNSFSSEHPEMAPAIDEETRLLVHELIKKINEQYKELNMMKKAHISQDERIDGLSSLVTSLWQKLKDAQENNDTEKVIEGLMKQVLTLQAANESMSKKMHETNEFLKVVMHCSRDTSSGLQLQNVYKCKTCNMTVDNKKGLCERCAILCHAGHSVSLEGRMHWCCQCDSKCACRISNPQNASECSFKTTGATLQTGNVWHCKTCSESGNNKSSVTVCDSCRRACHAGHDIVAGGTTEFYCNCGGCCECKLLKDERRCSVKYTGQRMVPQENFKCKTCKLSGICSVCSKSCHQGHEVSLVGTEPFVCSCGSGKCECMFREAVQEEDMNPDNYVCTFAITGKKMVKQPAFRCLTCGWKITSVCCEACAKICHSGHLVIPAGWSHSYCDCGAGICKCLLIKQ